MRQHSNGLAALRNAVRKRGWRGIAVLTASKVADRLFDARYGTDTAPGPEAEGDAGVVGDPAHAEPYEPTQVVALRRLLRTLHLGPGRVLVDFGSGKGRVLLVASAFGFRTLRGVEFSATLCETARANVERFRARTSTTARFEIIHADAAVYPVRDDEDVFFLFNPFDDHVLRQVMASIARSFAARPRPMVLLYRRPVYEECITRNSPLVKVATHVIWGSDFAVFEAQPSGAPDRGDAARLADA